MAWDGTRLALGLWGRAFAAGRPAQINLSDRLAMLAADAPVERPVRISWSARQWSAPLGLDISSDF